jgi:hypothetical protein
VLTSAGEVQVRAPRVKDKRVDPETGERKGFSSAILPAWERKAQARELLAALQNHVAEISQTSKRQTVDVIAHLRAAPSTIDANSRGCGASCTRRTD